MRTKLLLISLTLLSLASLGLSIDPDDTIVVQFNQAILEALANSTIPGTAGVRATALMNTAMYNAWVPYDAVAVPSQVTNFTRLPASDRTAANKETAAAYAAYHVLTTLIPNNKDLFDEVMANNSYDISNIPTEVSAGPSGVGTKAAIDLLALRENDNSNQLGDLNPSGVPYSEPILLEGYEPYVYINTADQLNDINFWQPQRLADGTAQEYMTPHWGIVTPFALTNGSEFRPRGPYTTADGELFDQQAQKVYNISQSLTDKEKLIAAFWAGEYNNTNPIPFMKVALDVAERDQNSLDDDIKMFFAVSNAIFDASIASFDGKRLYNSVRPVTVINDRIDPEWEPYIFTPNFPEYTSAHSGTSMAPAVVLREFTGSDVYNGSYTNPTSNITLNWANFTDAADEMGYSRLYAGVHFDRGDLDGRELGNEVGEVVWAKVQDLLAGTS